MEENNFDADWLNERYPYDVEARNKTIEILALDYLKEKKSLILVDIGAGTGSNCFYFLDKIEQDQSWIFIEKDPILAPILVKRLEEYATFHKYQWSSKRDRYEIKTPTKTVDFRIISDSFLDIARLIDLSKVDLLLANAVFDLFSKEQINDFLLPIIEEKIACLFTLNYSGMRFLPEDPFDYAYIELYEAHMERPQFFGQAAGKMAMDCLVDSFSKGDYQIDTGKSTWHILEEDIKMHYYILSFMENSLDTMTFKESLKEQFSNWLRRKKDLIITRQQQLLVDHVDLCVLPR